MKKEIILIIIVFLIVAIGGIFIFYKKEQNLICFKNYCFNVELAQTPEELSNGLMYREKLDSDKGMFFIFDGAGEYPFWMKNTLIPLDIIWINEKKEVVFINENTQPCKENPCPTINPRKNAEYVLEINSGTAQKIGLNVGDALDFNLYSYSIMRH